MELIYFPATSRYLKNLLNLFILQNRCVTFACVFRLGATKPAFFTTKELFCLPMYLVLIKQQHP
ncbi:hypothetical protein C7N43_15795 [Sphingobacteriales bacterium UPWRP_1]|nr:hypothetical protein BVG80_04440 [Sphingobacteriales bacterium TSM_CSM]PSJ76071.1 hypothetical protein C7N43_15795 [Sphingobacteriales bacterium UPWRP_1]